MDKHLSLSIIIPLYNAEKYIVNCLDSIYNQDIDSSDFEIIIVDDGSNDNSYHIISDYATKHDNIHIIHQENQGVACARNNAIKIAKGHYVTFIDSDDFFIPKSLKKVLRTAIEFKADIIKGVIIEVDEKEMFDDYRFTAKNIVTDVMDGKEAIVKVTRHKEGYSTGYLISLKLIKENNLHFPPKVSYMEDWAFITPALLNCKLFVNTNIPFYIYRHNTGSCVANMSTEKLLLSCQAIEIVAELAKKTSGDVQKKLSVNVCVNINIVLWFTIHYRSIFSRRNEIIRVLLQLLKQVDKSYIPRSLVIFKLCPELYIVIRNLLASRKY